MAFHGMCCVEGCDKPAYIRASRLCTTHYKRKWRHGSVDIVLQPKIREEFKLCEIEGCFEFTYATNTTYCKLHYQRNYRYGRTENVNRSDGGIDSNGYKVITVDGVRNYEHIFVAEKALGKKLPEGAVVHHMNEDKLDNFTPFNLIVCPDQAYHLLLHRRMNDMKLGIAPAFPIKIEF